MSEVIDRPGTDLVLGDKPMTALQLFAPGKVADVLDQIEADARAKKFDVSTPAGRDACRSYAFKLTRSKTAMDKMGKDLTEQWREKTNAVNAERRLIRERLEALEEEVRAPLTAIEEAEKARVAAHEAAIKEISAYAFCKDTIADIERAIDAVRVLYHPYQRDWQEFAARADDTKAQVLDGLAGRLMMARKAEEEAAELAKLRAEKAKRDAEEAARAQAEREKRIAAEAAENAKREAEQAAEQERIQALARERSANERAAKAERDAQEAAASAEAARVEAEADMKRREAAAAERERIRIEQEKAAEQIDAKRRAARSEHRSKINRQILGALMDPAHSFGLSETQAKALIIAISRGTLPYVTINY